MSFPRLALTLLLLLPAASAPAAELDPVVAEWLAEAREHVPELDTDELRSLMESDRELILLDVRLPAEREAGGSIDPMREVDIPRGYLELKAPDKLPDRDAAIVVYCGTGKRSLLGARTLQRMGYTDVRNYAGGLTAWEGGRPGGGAVMMRPAQPA